MGDVALWNAWVIPLMLENFSPSAGYYPQALYLVVGAQVGSMLAAGAFVSKNNLSGGSKTSTQPGMRT
jgi:hypothetical protein